CFSSAIPPDTGRSPEPRWTVTRIPAEGFPTNMATAGSVLWVRMGDDGSLRRLDPRTNRLVGSRVLCSTIGMTSAFGSLWAVSDNGNQCLPGGRRQGFSLFRIDPSDGGVTAEIPVQ